MAVTWQQWVNSFDSTTVGTGCSAVINTGAAFPDTNTLTSTIANATDTSDTAEGVITTHLPAGTEGRVRFKLRTPATFDLLNNSTFFSVTSADGTVADAFLDSTQTVKVFCTAGVLGTVGGTFSSGVVLAANTEYTFEFAWLRNGFLRLWIDGVLRIDQAESGASLSSVPTQIIFGIDHYDGTDTNGWSNVIRWGQIGDSATTALTDPTVAAVRARTLLGVGS